MIQPKVVLKLKYTLANNKALIGARCITVDGKKEFPKYHDQLLYLVGPEEIDNFVAVVWDEDDQFFQGAEAGFYHVARFEIDEDQTDFRVKVVNCVNNEDRKTCFRCGEETIKVPGLNSFYTICPMCKV